MVKKEDSNRLNFKPNQIYLKENNFEAENVVCMSSYHFFPRIFSRFAVAFFGPASGLFHGVFCYDDSLLLL